LYLEPSPQFGKPTEHESTRGEEGGSGLRKGKKGLKPHFQAEPEAGKREGTKLPAAEETGLWNRKTNNARNNSWALSLPRENRGTRQNSTAIKAEDNASPGQRENSRGHNAGGEAHSRELPAG